MNLEMIVDRYYKGRNIERNGVNRVYNFFRNAFEYVKDIVTYSYKAVKNFFYKAYEGIRTYFSRNKQKYSNSESYSYKKRLETIEESIRYLKKFSNKKDLDYIDEFVIRNILKNTYKNLRETLEEYAKKRRYSFMLLRSYYRKANKS